METEHGAGVSTEHAHGTVRGVHREGSALKQIKHTFSKKIHIYISE